MDQKPYIVLAIVLLLAASILVPAALKAKGKYLNKTGQRAMPLYFIENKGQMDFGQVKYYSLTGAATIYFTPKEAVYRFDGLSSKKGGSEKKQKIKGLVLRLEYLGADKNVEILGKDRAKARFNYLIGSNKNDHKTDIPSYFGVMYKKLYNGIDLVYCSKDGGLKSEFVVGKGGNVGDIRLRYKGIRSLAVKKNGDLSIDTEGGEITESKPYAYQVIDGRIVSAEARYVLLSQDTYGFEVLNYNKHYPLIIDPTLTFAGYIGGTTGNDWGSCIYVDASGYIYICGDLSSVDFPVTAGAYKSNLSSTQNIFISKLTPNTDSLVFSTYFGGSASDWANALKADASGNVYLGGYTSSTDLPTTSGSFASAFAGGSFDSYVLKLNSTGSSVLYCSYFGGNGSDVAYAADVDSSFDIYLSGYTGSSDLPVSANAYKKIYPGDTTTFAAKISPDGSGLNDLVYSTYIGSGQTRQMQVDNDGNACLAGTTGAIDYPVTAGCFQPSYGGGAEDAFVTKLNPDGSDLVFSTYLGGSGLDRGFHVSVDSLLNVYAGGIVTSTDFPVTAGALQTTNPLASQKIFISKLNPSGTSLMYSTYVGGSGSDTLGRIHPGQSGEIFLVGHTSSDDFPVTANAYQKERKGGNDGILVRLNPMGGGTSDLIYSTYFGGSLDERFKDLYITSNNSCYIFGYTDSLDMPVTPGVYSGTNAGGADSIYLKFDFGPPAPSSFAGIASSTSSLSHSWIINSTNESGFYITDGSGNIKVHVAAGTSTTLESGLLPNTLYTSKCVAYNNDGASTSDAVSRYTSIESPSGIDFSGVSSTRITLNASNAFSNLSLGSSGLLFENITAGTSSGWIKTNTWTSTGLSPDTEYSFRIKTKNGDGIENPAGAVALKKTAEKRLIKVYSAGVQILDGDIISSKFKISGIVLTSEAVDSSSVRIYIDGSVISDGTYAHYDSFLQEADKTAVEYTIRTALAVGTHTLKITADGLNGTSYEAELTALKVIDSNSPSVVGAVLAYPNPYDPAGGNTKITYTMQKDSDTVLFIFGVTGKLLLKRDCFSGTNGGKAGFNEVEWDGKNDFGEVVGNGIYAARIVEKNSMKVIGRCKIAVIHGYAAKRRGPFLSLAVLLLAMTGLVAANGALRLYGLIGRRKK